MANSYLRCALPAALLTLGTPCIQAADAWDAGAASIASDSQQDGVSTREPARENSGSLAGCTDWGCDEWGGCGCANCDCADCWVPRGWVRGEYLLWWTNGVRLPPLVAASPAGTPLGEAAILDGPNTEILFGDQVVGNDAQHGFRIGAGYWLDGDCTCALEGSFFLLGNQSQSLTAGSADGSQIVGRPFFNVQTDQGAAELVSFPGVVSGFVTATAGSSDFLGADIGWRKAICCTNCSRLDWTAGYRFFHYTDEVIISERLTPGGPVVPGTEINLVDSFTARNQFHGGYLGIVAARNRGPWTLEALARLDIGAVVREVDIDGQTTASVPGFGSATSSGGLLALSSNMGSHQSADAIVIPEFEIRTKYRIGDNWQLVVGYTLIYWGQVARAGDQIDLAVNPDLLPPPIDPASGPLRPRYQLDRSDLVVQGLSLGLEWSF